MTCALSISRIWLHVSDQRNEVSLYIVRFLLRVDWASKSLQYLMVCVLIELNQTSETWVWGSFYWVWGSVYLFFLNCVVVLEHFTISHVGLKNLFWVHTPQLLDNATHCFLLMRHTQWVWDIGHCELVCHIAEHLRLGLFSQRARLSFCNTLNLLLVRVCIRFIIRLDQWLFCDFWLYF